MPARLHETDGVPTIRLTRRLPHSPERVWKAVTDPAEMEGWFVAPVPWTPVPGETFEAAGQSGRITELDPPRVIAWEWGQERYRIDIEPAEGGCVLTFHHVFTTEYGPGEQHAAGWEIYFGRLDTHLFGGFADELEAHTQCVSDEFVGRPAVRFHRRLDAPAERVWRAVTDEAELMRWFPCAVTMEPHAGGAMQFDFAPDFQLTGTVLEFDPPRVFDFEWGDDRIRMELLSVGGGSATLLSFTHVLSEPEDSLARNAAGWQVCLDGLAAQVIDDNAARVEHGRTPAWEAAMEAYVARGYPSGAPVPSR